jgi:hypothetical protein
MATIIEIKNYRDDNDIYRKCLINYNLNNSSENPISFDNVILEINSTWQGKSEKRNFKTWHEIEEMFTISAGELGTLQKNIALSVKNTQTNSIESIKIKWMPYDGENRRRLANEHPNVLAFLLPYDKIYEEIVARNNNPAKLGLCARLAKINNEWIMYLMVCGDLEANSAPHDTMFFNSSHAGGGNSGVRIPPLTEEG